ncbi:hypothetical protein K9M18_00245 [Candidatus Woesearchaeota archaeon]|nr:hypothetical protein [Candidatus Woesearchaeota archaeon]MCF8012956.1 hypothetical protein [Candidatus Woesearchaeota archaeon]
MNIDRVINEVAVDFVNQLELENLNHSQYLVSIFSSLVSAASSSLNSKDLDSKLNNKGIVVPYNGMSKHLLNPKIADYLDHNILSTYKHPFEIRIHKPSYEKTNIGYAEENIVITLAYQNKTNDNNFLVFTRDSQRQKVPRSVLKKITGTKDILSASKRAEESLSNTINTGSMGPFFLRENKEINDQIIVDQDSYNFHAKNHDYVNFSGGHGMISVNMKFIDAVDLFYHVFRKENVHVKSLFNP